MRSSGIAMRIAGGILTCLLGVMLLALGVAGSGVGEWLGATLAGWAAGVGSRVFLALAGLLVLAFDLVLLLRFVGFGTVKVIEFEGPAGQMAIDVTALEECLHRTATDDPDVTDADVRLVVPTQSSKRPITMNVDVDVRERVDIPGKGAAISQRLSRRFLDIVPLDREPVVNVGIRIRPSEGDEEGAQGRPSEGSGAPGEAEEANEEDERLPDIPEFTGERRYVSKDGREGDADEADEKNEGVA